MGSPAVERRGGSCARRAPVGIYPTVCLLHCFYAAARGCDAFVMCFAFVACIACITHFCPRSCRPPLAVWPVLLTAARTASSLAQDSGPETRAEKQSLALDAVGRILEHHSPAAAAAPSKHPDYWPGISFFAKRREQAWRERKAEKKNAMRQELREQAPTGPNGQKLSPAQAAIAAKFDALNGGSSKNYDEMRKEYERETGHKLRPSAPAHRGGAREWGSTWKLPDERMGPEGRENGSRRQSLEGRGTHEPMTGDEEGPGIETEERYQRP